MPDKDVKMTVPDNPTARSGNTAGIDSHAFAAARTSAKRRLLFCGVQSGIEDMQRLFAEHYDLITCQRMSEAEERLVPEIDLIVCGTQFDEGAMFSLLRHAKAEPGTKNIPFLCIRIAGGDLHETLFQSVSLSSRALGAAGFIDVFRWRREYGEDETDRRLRRAIDRLAGAARYRGGRARRSGSSMG